MDWAEPHVLQNATKQKKIKTNKQLDKGDGLPPAYAFLSARVLRPLTARTEAELTLRHPEHTETPRRRPEVILSRSAPLSAAPVNGSAFDSSPCNSLSPLSPSPAGPPFADPLGHLLPFLLAVLSPRRGGLQLCTRGDLRRLLRTGEVRSPQTSYVPGHARSQSTCKGLTQLAS